METKTNTSSILDYDKCIICQEKANSKKRTACVQIDYIDKVKVSS